MATWAEIITQAFVDMAVIQVGETITAGMQSDAFTRLKSLISSLSAEGLIAFNQVEQAFQLVSGTTAYTLGSGGTFSTTGNLRAQRVTAWRAYYSTLLSSGGPILSMAEFGAQAVQKEGELTSIPRLVAADTSYPLINVRVWPPPSAVPGILELAYWTPITAPSAVGDTISLPEGWENFLHFQLAVALYPQYSRTGGMDPVLAANASNSKQVLLQQNATGAVAESK